MSGQSNPTTAEPTGGSPQASSWWVFLPFKGLDISDEQPDLEAPLFGDATIISKKHMVRLVPRLRMNERMAPGRDHEADLLYLLQNATFREDFQSFVAVRRSARIDQSDARRSQATYGYIVQKAKVRAERIASLLSLVLLTNSETWSTCGLVEQIHSHTKTVTMLSFDLGGV